MLTSLDLVAGGVSQNAHGILNVMNKGSPVAPEVRTPRRSADIIYGEKTHSGATQWQAER